MKRKSAFTLIELLVVISIIAVLAAILFPVFAAAKGASKKTAALENLAQIGKAVQMYASDHDEHLPSRFPIESEWPGYNTIMLVIGGNSFDKVYDPYIKNKSIWFSPEDRLPDKGYTSFAFNEQLAFAWSLSSISRPAETIYMTDRTDIPQADHPPVDTYVWWTFITEHPFSEEKLPGKIDPVSVATQIAPIRYTGEVGLYQFLDSHVAAMPFGRTWGDAAHNLHLATKS
jgi:prepilin-type N-terminal cleavage/methylation domain-containing protein